MDIAAGDRIPVKVALSSLVLSSGSLLECGAELVDGASTDKRSTSMTGQWYLSLATVQQPILKWVRVLFIPADK